MAAILSIPQSADDFGQAAAAAEAEAGGAWWHMQPAERTAAIYRRLRQMDDARAAAIEFRPGARGRYRVAGEPVRRKHSPGPGVL